MSARRNIRLMLSTIYTYNICCHEYRAVLLHVVVYVFVCLVC